MTSSILKVAVWSCVVVLLLSLQNAASANDDRGLPGAGTGVFQGGPAAPATSFASNGFPCGPQLSCNAATQFCAVVISGLSEQASGYQCVELPEGAAVGGCESLPRIGDGCQCSDTGAGITVTCTAP
jgi:hypothetical protein